MSIIRLIHIKIDPSETETAERIWKTECATLMISQKGCMSENCCVRPGAASSSPIPNGKRRQTLSVTRAARHTNRSSATRAA
jgi:hypothetical protein